jgi:hypothetical protein
MYRILFIDEEQAAFDEFNNYIDDNQTEKKFELITQPPLESLDKMLHSIFKINPDVLITDFILNEYRELVQYNVPYDGVELIYKFLSIREGFPCFVMTSYDDTAINKSNDVNIVYVKNIFHNEKQSGVKANFLKRLELQIEHYKHRIDGAEEELLKLISLRIDGKATIHDEENIIRLDNFLEKAIDRRSSIPENFKLPSNSKRLEQILLKADELLRKYEEKNEK